MKLDGVAETLERFGEVDLAARVRSALTAEEAVLVGDDLEVRGDKILRTNCGEPETEEDRAFLGDCEDICVTGAWYRKLGEDGFGVRLTTMFEPVVMTDP